MEKRGRFEIGDPVPFQGIQGQERGVHVDVGVEIAAAVIGSWDVPESCLDDLRTLPVRYETGGSGARFRPFRDGAHMCTESTIAGWPIDGPRTCQWLVSTLGNGDTTPCRRHEWWKQVQHLSVSDEGVQEHECLCEILETALTTDQLNVSELVSFEHLARRIQVWEEAYSASLAGSTTGGGPLGRLGLEERAAFMGKRHTSGSPLVAPALQTWVSARMAEKSAILKERRKGREERGLAATQPSVATPKAEGGGGGGGKTTVKNCDE